MLRYSSNNGIKSKSGLMLQRNQISPPAKFAAKLSPCESSTCTERTLPSTLHPHISITPTVCGQMYHSAARAAASTTPGAR